MNKLVPESLDEMRLINEVERKTYPDLTDVKGSVGASIEDLVKNMDQYGAIPELKDALMDVLNNPKTKVSRAKKISYIEHLDKIYTLRNLQKYITNIYLKAANLGIH